MTQRCGFHWTWDDDPRFAPNDSECIREAGHPRHHEDALGRRHSTGRLSNCGPYFAHVAKWGLLIDNLDPDLPAEVRAAHNAFLKGEPEPE